MKKLVLGALCIVLGFAANAKTVQINGLYYDLDDETKTAEVANDLSYRTDLKGDVEILASVTDGGNSYAVTSIGMDAFSHCALLESVSAPSVTSIGDSAFSYCPSLESVSAPSVTSIGDGAFVSCTALKSVYAPSVTSIEMMAFVGCNSLTSLTVNSAMKEGWDSNKSSYGIDGDNVNPENVTFLTTPTLKCDQVVQAGWKTTVTVSTALKSGDTTLDKTEYEYACGFYGITPKTEPTAEDFKVVSKDAQVVQEGEIAVTKESLQTAKAETVQIVDGVVYLGVSVLSNSDITASTAWAPVKFPAGTQIGLTADGTKLIIPVPAAAQSGFMILQSGEGKIVTSGGGPTPTSDYVRPDIPDNPDRPGDPDFPYNPELPEVVCP